MSERIDIRLAGAGGQGVILGAIILAEAAIAEGKEAVQTQSYGPEARGGATKAEVIVSTGGEIDYPKVVMPDVVLAMNQESYMKFGGSVKKGGTLLVDTTFVENAQPGDAKLYKIPITDLAREATGRPLVANIVAMAALNEITGLVSRETLTNAVLARVPKGTEELNKKALDAGFEAARRLMG